MQVESSGVELRGVWRRALPVLPTLALVGMLFGGVLWAHRYFTHAPHFALKAVRFSGMVKVAVDKLSARADVALGSNLFSVDLRRLERRIAEEPWVKAARAHVELPSIVAVEIEERKAVCLVALGSLYLSDEEGHLFKRAVPSEATGLPVVTGLSRALYESDERATRSEVRLGLLAWRLFAAGGRRPEVGEINLDRTVGITLFLAADGGGIRLGRSDGALADLGERIDRFDAVWNSLGEHGERPRMIYLDNRTRPDRVAVKLARSAEGRATNHADSVKGN